jgi:hypothetical protein
MRARPPPRAEGGMSVDPWRQAIALAIMGRRILDVHFADGADAARVAALELDDGTVIRMESGGVDVTVQAPSAPTRRITVSEGEAKLKAERIAAGLQTIVRMLGPRDGLEVLHGLLGMLSDDLADDPRLRVVAAQSIKALYEAAATIDNAREQLRDIP